MEEKLDKIIELLEQLNNNISSLNNDNKLDYEAIEKLRNFHASNEISNSFEDWILALSKRL